MQENSEALRNISLVFASLIGLPLLGWRGITAYRQANISQGQADTAQQSLLNERYQKGAEMLGNSALAVRMGGIYALQRLTEDHPKQFYIQMMELLCAFVRLPTEDKNLKQRQMEDETSMTKLCYLFVRMSEAVIVAIGSLRKTGKELEKDDFKLNLQRAQSEVRGFSRSEPVRRKSVNAQIYPAQARLDKANLSGADLRSGYANLSHAHLSLKCKSVRRISHRAQICPAHSLDG